MEKVVQVPERRTDQPVDEWFPILTAVMQSSGFLLQEPHEAPRRLCQEVERLTGKRAHLLLYSSPSSNPGPFSASSSPIYPVQCRDRLYGVLETTTSTATAFSLDVSLLAHLCGLLLYSLEMTALIATSCQENHISKPTDLTQRERDVLKGIIDSNDLQAIADALTISPATVRKHQQSLYRKLGVANKQDTLLAAYCQGLFAPIAGLSPRQIK